MLCYVMLCDVVLYYVMLCEVMLRYATLCYAMLCYVVLCDVMLCEVGYIFRVSPKGHPVYTLTNIKKEPYIHSPVTEI